MKKDLLPRTLRLPGFQSFLSCITVTTTILLLAAARAHAGGGWTRQPGHGHVKVGFTLANTTKYHPFEGGTIDTAQFRQ